MRAPDSSSKTLLSTGLQNPRTGTVSIIKIFLPKTTLLRIGIQYGAMTEAAGSLIGQIDCSKHTVLR
jgi:hypothetical protein